MLTLDEATARAKRMVQDVGERLDPGDDWVPCVFTYGERNGIIVIPELGVPGAKDVICQIALPALVGELAPDWAALVSMGWAIKYQDTLESTARRARDEAVGYVGGSYAEHPDKVEVLTLLVASANEMRQCTANVTRSPDKAPVLEWGPDCTHDGESRVEGRFADALRAAFKPSAGA